MFAYQFPRIVAPVAHRLLNTAVLRSGLTGAQVVLAQHHAEVGEFVLGKPGERNIYFFTAFQELY